MKTKMLGAGDIVEAAQIIMRGGLVAVPTETVYGLAGNGLDEAAVRRIYDVKGRPEVKPLALMVPNFDSGSKFFAEPSQAAATLADAFWPGPLTLVAKAADGIPDIVRAGQGTIALRCPNHLMTLWLLEELSVPLAAPSANPSGRSSPKTAAEVLEYFDGEVDAILDGGRCELGLESTILDVGTRPLAVLRQGALPSAEIFAELERNMRIIGITGPTGAGKTTALGVLSELGGAVLDCDALYHELLAANRELVAEIEARFPGTATGGSVDRKKLGSVVFGDPAALLDLNAITHRYIGAEIGRRISDFAASGYPATAIDAIALIEGGLAKRCEAVIGILATGDERIRRIMEREGIGREYAESRVNAQKGDDYFRQNCDIIIENDGDLASFREKCRFVFANYTGG